ncbi:UNVERIFIED_CONTAM: hypothetical protein K2H54_055216 [Gekko kuhli]
MGLSSYGPELLMKQDGQENPLTEMQARLTWGLDFLRVDSVEIRSHASLPWPATPGHEVLGRLATEVTKKMLAQPTMTVTPALWEMRPQVVTEQVLARPVPPKAPTLDQQLAPADDTQARAVVAEETVLGCLTQQESRARPPQCG